MLHSYHPPLQSSYVRAPRAETPPVPSARTTNAVPGSVQNPICDPSGDHTGSPPSSSLGCDPTRAAAEPSAGATQIRRMTRPIRAPYRERERGCARHWSSGRATATRTDPLQPGAAVGGGQVAYCAEPDFCPLTGPMPVTMPAPGSSSSYMPLAASGLSSRNAASAWQQGWRVPRRSADPPGS
jgi:hypothetical protein